MSKIINGFSKLSKNEKINWIISNYLNDDFELKSVLSMYWNSDTKLQQLHDDFIENTITNYYLPLGIAPNFVINGKTYAIPMAIEESSVVAAASKSAKFWMSRGGFNTKIIATTKVGHVHFVYNGDYNALQTFFNTVKPKLISASKNITKNMEKRGGGILDIELKDKTASLDNYYQLHATFETLDAMGANFINSCLEQFAKTFKEEANNVLNGTIDIIMSILSNYVPNCIVRTEVSCAVEDLNDTKTQATKFAEKFVQAVTIAKIEPYRAVTHNKGIMNGIDAVVLATGNDFRAVEAGIHAYASRNGQYTSLSDATIDNGIFTFSMEVPLALGTVGGLTNLHPLVKLALRILDMPSAQELMQIIASVGLAQNFAAIQSLVTTGIQEGHMKMHLLNILNQFEASDKEKQQIIDIFKRKTVTHSAVVEEIKKLRH